ncbi:MAG: glycosyltransferase family 2 protein [Rhodospirillales bacterium]
MSDITLSALITVHNEEDQLTECLERLSFADEIVVVLDKCTDSSKEIALGFTDSVHEGAWDIEGDRRNDSIGFCKGDWVFEIDADERVPQDLALEIRHTVETTSYDWHEILVDNYIGSRLVRWGWGASFGKAAYPGLFRKGVKEWGRQRVHPALKWSGRKGPMLTNRLDHYVDEDISGLIRKLDNYSTARARDLREAGETWGSTASNVRRIFSRFYKCYVRGKGYREGGYGLLIALLAGLYPLLSHLKAKLEKDPS